MAKAGDILHSPDFGETLKFIRTAADTDGAWLEIEATYTPHQNWEDGVEHYHPEQDETFEVVAGMISVKLDGRERTYMAGEQFEVGRGVVHLMRNLSSEPARLRWQVRPALDTETFFETVWGLSADGKLAKGTLSYVLRFAVLAQAYKRVFRVTQPPRPIQQILFPILATIGRWLGYRAWYPQYSHPEQQQRSNAKSI